MSGIEYKEMEMLIIRRWLFREDTSTITSLFVIAVGHSSPRIDDQKINKCG